MDVKHRFQVAATRAEAARSPEDWLSLTPSARADAIYRELRQLDMAAASSETYSPDDLEREIRKAHRRVTQNERRLAIQMARIDEMQQKELSHAVTAAKTLLRALEARLELSKQRLRQLQMFGLA